MRKSRWTSKNIPDQTGRVAIVTGANSGIGFETAKALAEHGATVVVAARSAERGEAAVAKIRQAAPKSETVLMVLDLANLESVRPFAEEFRGRYDRLDLLINNAGVMMPAKREETADGFELQFGTNHLGHFALTAALMDRLTSTEGSRVVNVASSAQNFGRYDPDDLQWETRSFRRMGSYGASKIANMLFTLELQRRFEASGSGMIAVSCHPGWTSTNLQKTSPLFRAMNPFFAMQPWQGALPTLYAATSPDAVGGKYYGPHGLGNLRGYPVENRPAKASRDKEYAKRLWADSERWTGRSASAST